MREPRILADLLVESSPAAARSGRQHRKAFVAAVMFQGFLVAVLLFAPLASPGRLSQPVVVVPIPPYAAGSQPTHGSPHTHPTHPKRTIFETIPLLPSSQIPRPHESEASEAPGTFGPTVPGASGVPWGITGGTTPTPPAIRPPEPKRSPETAHVVRPSEVQAAALIYRVDPVYPKMALQIRLSGMARLRAIIGTDGDVRRLEVLSGHPLLAKAARDAVQQWRYRPTILNGVPVEVETTITVNFVLSQ